jgi:hypothetical protein
MVVALNLAPSMGFLTKTPPQSIQWNHIVFLIRIAIFWVYPLPQFPRNPNINHGLVSS